ncbi:hypothetical protein EDD85DRAFT_783005 [Armillaria nabsnona]|nr:hypothetical protein EDD85DRAFT_783005 [Armillaria nabsnona]
MLSLPYLECSTMVKLSYECLTRRLHEMAQPTDPAELAKVQAQDAYNAAAATIDGLLDDFPSPTWDSTRMDTWLIDAVTHWSTCEENWLAAGVVSKEWYKVEYIRRALTKRSKMTASPSIQHQDTAVLGSQLTMPALLPMPSKTPTPVLLLATPKPLTSNSGASNEQVAQLSADKVAGAQQHTAQRKVKPMPITTGSGDVVFPLDTTSLLHQKPGRDFKVGPPIHAARSTSSVQLLSSQLLTVDGSVCSEFADFIC